MKRSLRSPYNNMFLKKFQSELKHLAHTQVEIFNRVTLDEKPGNETELREDATLGVIRLDYDYPATPGDIDCVDSFDYDVIYRVVPGLTFEMCMSGRWCSCCSSGVRNLT